MSALRSPHSPLSCAVRLSVEKVSSGYPCGSARPIGRKIRVAIVQLIVPEYKIHLFRELSLRDDLEILVLHGGVGDRLGPRPWKTKLPFPSLEVSSWRVPVTGRLDIHYQNVLHSLKAYRPNVVVLQDGVRIMSNYIVHRWCRRKGIAVAYYTHGRNRQGQRHSTAYTRIVERIRRGLLRNADVTVAYSMEVVEDLARAGVPRSRIFMSPNTLPTEEIGDQVDRVSLDVLDRLRRDLKVGCRHIVVYLGRLVEEKNPELLVEAAVLSSVREIPFHAIFVGDGPLRGELKAWGGSRGLPVSFVGHQSVTEAAPYLKMADVVCVPGMTGLAVVHAFAAGRPYVTCELSDHSPEITYLRDGVNGRLIQGRSGEALCQALIELLRDDCARRQMGERARQTARLECDPRRQVDGFADGVLAAWGRPR